MRLEHQGLWLVAGATVFWSLSGVFVRWMPGLDPWTFNAYRGLGMGLSMLLWMQLHYGRDALALWRRTEPKAIVISAGFFAAGSSLYILAMNLASVAAVSCLGATSGLFAAFLARVWLGERTPAVFYAALVLALGGVVLIAMGEQSNSVTGFAGTLVALAVAFSFAGQSVALRRFKSLDMEPAMVVGGLGVFVVVLASGLLKPVPFETLCMLLFMGAIQLAVPMVLYMRGARQVAAVQMVLITMADAFLNPFWVWLVHGELPAQAVYAGGMLVLGGIVLSNWAAKSARP